MRLCLGRLAMMAAIAAAMMSFGIDGTAGLLQAAETERKLPRFVSLRAAEVNLRSGPGQRYPIEWVYRKRGLPVEITSEFDKWRRIRDHEGTIGWVHQSLLSGRRTALVTDAQSVLRREPDGGSAPVARVTPGVVGALLACADKWCRLEIGDYRGWLPRANLFGIYAGESLDD